MTNFVILAMTKLYSLYDIVTIILSACAAIITISGAIVAISTLVNRVKKPTKLIVERVEKCESRLTQHDERLLKINDTIELDRKSITELANENKITLKTLLAMMEYMLNDEDKNRLIVAKDKLHNFLVSKE